MTGTKLPDALAEVLRLADSLADAAEDYRFVIPQFHAGNRRSMKARASTIDEAIAGLRALGPAIQAMADDARRYAILRACDDLNLCARRVERAERGRVTYPVILGEKLDAAIDALNPIAKGDL